jgi:hypothetical protein
VDSSCIRCDDHCSRGVLDLSVRPDPISSRVRPCSLEKTLVSVLKSANWVQYAIGTAGEGGAPLEMLAAPFLRPTKEALEDYAKTGPDTVGIPLNVLLAPPEGTFIKDPRLHMLYTHDDDGRNG